MTVTTKAAPAAIRTCVLYLDFVDALGDHLAALVASRIYWWCVVPAKNGKTKLRVFKEGQLWLAKSHVDWEAELGLTRRQMDRVMALLDRHHLIETMVTMFNGKPTTHIRYVGSIDPEHRLSPTVNVVVTPPPNAPVGANECTATCKRVHQNVHSITCNTDMDNNMTSNKQLASSSPSAADVLKSFSQAVKMSTKAGGVLVMKTTWKKLQPEHLGFQKELTAKEIGQLKIVHTALSEQALPTMEWVLKNWQQFAAEVQGLKGVAVVPTIPVTGFFCQHYEVAVNLMNKPKHVVQSVALPTAAPKKVTVPEDVHTPVQSDYLDLMAQLDKLTKK